MPTKRSRAKRQSTSTIRVGGKKTKATSPSPVPTPTVDVATKSTVAGYVEGDFVTDIEGSNIYIPSNVYP